MIDIHCHILPGVDDGPKSWEAALEMCRIAQADGITHIVASPHANDQYDYHRQKHLRVLQQLRRRIDPSLMLTLACDFHFSAENLQRLRRHPSEFTIGSTPYLLVELSNYALPAKFEARIADLINTGITPVITHPERNPLVQQRPQQVLRWVASGAVVQVTADAFTGRWGTMAQDLSFWLLEQNAVHVIASDAHDPVDRLPLLSPARKIVAEHKGQDIATALVCGNPQAIVNGEALPYFPRPRI
ncbi:MAG: tyrosine-protein phosphatase [Terriglobales bacterium]